MTAILDEIRRLEAARKRGDMSASEYATARGELLASVEDVDLEASPNQPRRPPRPAPAAAPAARHGGPAAGKDSARPAAQESTQDGAHPWGLMLLGLLAAGLMTFLVGQVIGDMTIALTLTVTVFAAILIAAFQRMQQ